MRDPVEGAPAAPGVGAERRALSAGAGLRPPGGAAGCMGGVSRGPGRGSSGWRGRRLPAKTAWVLQELPSLVWPLCECVRASSERLRSWPNRILLAMFIVHYGHRFCLVVIGHADQHPLRSHPEEPQKTRGDWIPDSQG
uniref:Steroid 5 alpha-reductase 1 n=1 Tax=Spermophilus dauricus TaxID=99837 RepID=A0A8C9Q9P7_SPEDA